MFASGMGAPEVRRRMRAVKVTCHIEVVTTATVDGQTLDPNKSVTGTMGWYALGVGIVKSVSTGDGGNETVQLTKDFIP